jgi:ectoine hydroxylase-related dioxygenase (phytanoyl-CoA dioxygenase family)
MSQTGQAMPELKSDYPISEEQRKQYLRDGHILLKGVCSKEEIGAWRQVIKDTALRFSKENRPVDQRDTYGKAFLQIGNLWEKEPATKPFVLARRFAKIAADLTGSEGIRLYHDQALFKEAGGGLTPWHQDQFYWPLDTDKTITLWMPLVDCTEQMGTMRFASRSQAKGYLGDIAISDESEALFKKMIADQGFELAGGKAMQAGDATFHSGWVLHAASPNTTGVMREAMTIIYNADGARLVFRNKTQVDEANYLFIGLKEGDLAEGANHPLIYKK